MKIVVSDFDLTFFNENYKENIDLVKDFVNKGNMFIIATGRPYHFLKKDLDKNIPFEYLICNDGALILDKNLNVFFKNTFTPDDNLTKILTSKDYIRKLYLDKKDNQLLGIYASFSDCEKAQQLLTQILKNNNNLTGYLSSHWINIISNGTSKYQAIKKIQDAQSFSNDMIYTIGDNVNDQAMIENYHGYIVSNLQVNAKKVKNFSEFMQKIK